MKNIEEKKNTYFLQRLLWPFFRLDSLWTKGTTPHDSTQKTFNLLPILSRKELWQWSCSASNV